MQPPVPEGPQHGCLLGSRPVHVARVDVRREHVEGLARLGAADGSGADEVEAARGAVDPGEESVLQRDGDGEAVRVALHQARVVAAVDGLCGDSATIVIGMPGSLRFISK